MPIFGVCGGNPRAIAAQFMQINPICKHPAARATSVDHEPCAPRATTWGEFLAELLPERQKKFGRDAHNRPDVGLGSNACQIAHS